MRAAWYERKGAPNEVLQIGEMADPIPGAGEVRVRVHVSGINPSDTKQRAGWNNSTDMPYPRIIPHNDGAGEIDKIGPGVRDSLLGERVWIYEAQRNDRAFGTAAEYVVVPVANAVPLPKTASYAEGASLGVPGMTAHRLLFADGGIQGKAVLVAGGAGSVGHMAVQLARWAGATVIATVGSETQADFAAQCGAHHVVNYKKDDLVHRVAELVGKADGIDRIIEVAFAQNADLDGRLISPNGIIATYMISEDDPRPALALQPLLIKDVTVRFTLVYTMSRVAHEAAIADLNAALTAGALKPRIARRFSLEEIADVHKQLGTGGMGGKAVIELFNTKREA